ncbi:MAG: hypothetical protein H7124_08940 [Phycisphaerales bacterium]|nr:hypothetical protein [Hyphomonadaceae bacterium]
MADIYEAYRILSDTYNLGLSDKQIAYAEAMAKASIIRREGLPMPSNLTELASVEVFARIERGRASDAKLKQLTQEIESDIAAGIVASPFS